jgi:hypothetical protein
LRCSSSAETFLAAAEQQTGASSDFQMDVNGSDNIDLADVTLTQRKQFRDPCRN